ncbi:hypothetical protein CLF_109797, partial [Clonorchis sinensis]
MDVTRRNRATLWACEYEKSAAKPHRRTRLWRPLHVSLVLPRRITLLDNLGPLPFKPNRAAYVYEQTVRFAQRHTQPDARTDAGSPILLCFEAKSEIIFDGCFKIHEDLLQTESAKSDGTYKVGLFLRRIKAAEHGQFAHREIFTNLLHSAFFIVTAQQSVDLASDVFEKWGLSAVRPSSFRAFQEELNQHRKNNYAIFIHATDDASSVLDNLRESGWLCIRTIPDEYHNHPTVPVRGKCLSPPLRNFVRESLCHGILIFQAVLIKTAQGPRCRQSFGRAMNDYCSGNCLSLINGTAFCAYGMCKMNDITPQNVYFFLQVKLVYAEEPKKGCIAVSVGIIVSAKLGLSLAILTHGASFADNNQMTEVEDTISLFFDCSSYMRFEKVDDHLQNTINKSGLDSIASQKAIKDSKKRHQDVKNAVNSYKKRTKSRSFRFNDKHKTMYFERRRYFRRSDQLVTNGCGEGFRINVQELNFVGTSCDITYKFEPEKLLFLSKCAGVVREVLENGTFLAWGDQWGCRSVPLEIAVTPYYPIHVPTTNMRNMGVEKLYTTQCHLPILQIDGQVDVACSMTQYGGYRWVVKDMSRCVEPTLRNITSETIDVLIR